MKKFLSEVGGKAYSLIKLRDLKYNVPKFFVITSQMFKEFIEFNKLEDKIETLLKSKQFEEIQEIIIDGNFEKEMEQWVVLNFEKLHTKEVSVRSSCSQEDGENKSYAGQFYTGLNITKENLFIEIKKCFASLFSKHLKDYAEEIYNNFEMAVVVQQMINSDFAGVAFSVDYSGQNENTLIIEACKGTGEKLVSGLITPTKYFIRKKHNFIEFVEGNKLLIEDKIKELAIIVEKIERDYKMPMDVEWAIYNNELFILQARPIVGFINLKNTYKFAFSRPNLLAMVQLDELAEREGMSDIFNGLYYFKPLFLFNENHIFEAYYSISKFEEYPKCMVNYILQNKEKFIKYCDNIFDACNKLYNNLNNGTYNIGEIIKIYKIVGALSNIANFFEKTNVICDYNIGNDDEFIYKITKNRELYDNIAYKINDILKEEIKKILPEKCLKYYSVITLEEMQDIKKVNFENIKERYEKGFIYYKGNIFLLNKYQEFFNKENINLLLKSNEENIINEDNTIKGLVAYPGKVMGKVKVVYNEEDLLKIKKGDIIVSPMTTPTFISVMNKVAAIITDEGGTVCHAALIARELKKTCIVGTKCASTYLEDNMMVEVDGDNGIIKILEEDK